MKPKIRLSRRSAAMIAMQHNDQLQPYHRLIVDDDASLIKVSGCHRRYTLYYINGLYLCVVLKEWQLPSGNWRLAAAIGRYQIYYDYDGYSRICVGVL